MGEVQDRPDRHPQRQAQRQEPTDLGQATKKIAMEPGVKRSPAPPEKEILLIFGPQVGLGESSRGGIASGLMR
jgi:hypothetical protein